MRETEREKCVWGEREKLGGVEIDRESCMIFSQFQKANFERRLQSLKHRKKGFKKNPKA